MTTETLQWAAFCAVLVPLFVFGPGTAALFAMSCCMAALATQQHG
jgi:hypothetical protein